MPGLRASLLLLLSGAFLALHFWTWFASLERTSVGSSVVIVASQPLLGALLGFAAYRERPALAEWRGIGIASLGLLIIAGFDLANGSPDLAGNALALLGGIFGAAYRTVGRGMRRTMGATGYSASVYLVAAALLWLGVTVERPAVSGFGGDTWTFLLLLGLVPQLIGHTAFNWALGRLRVVTVGIAALGEPVLATLIAIPVLAEKPGIGVILGGPLIIAGVVVALRGLARETPKDDDSGSNPSHTAGNPGRGGAL
jgi:drug/metabolite transporter (DMT)-like permease